MEESLKTVRLVQRVLIATCAASLLFGLTPSETRRLKLAIAEIEDILQLDFDTYTTDIIDSIDDAKDYRTKMRTDLEEVNWPTTTTRASAAAGLSLGLVGISLFSCERDGRLQRCLG